MSRTFRAEITASADPKRTTQQMTRHLAELTRLARLTLSDKNPEAICQLAADHNIEVDNGVLARMSQMVEDVCRDGVNQAERRGVIDYTDMIWMPVALDLPTPTYEWMFVDEAQDLSAAQRELVLKCRAAGGRALFVGDERQAIMGFAGADFNSYREIATRTQATELPLSICYRCPSSHIKLAQQIVPAILPRDDAPDGEIRTIDQPNLHAEIQEGDLVLCRMTAPLISECINLIRHRIPARVRGRDVANQLITLAHKVGDKQPFEKFVALLETYRAERITILERKKNAENQIVQMNDTVDALIACAEEFNARDIDDLCQQIQGIFSDDRPSVWLSTIHRAKGLEAERVYILRPEKLPLTWAKQTDEQYTQELNLQYVAYTRAKKTLTMCNDVPAAAAKGAPAAAPTTSQEPVVMPVAAQQSSFVANAA